MLLRDRTDAFLSVLGITIDITSKREFNKPYRSMYKAIILGSGPDSLNAAYLALGRDIHPIILEPTGSLFGHQSCDSCSTPCTSLKNLQSTVEIYLHQLVRTVYYLHDEICSLHVIDGITGELNLFAADYFYFPGPLHTLLTAMSHVPGHRFLPERKFRNLMDETHLSAVTIAREKSMEPPAS
jgi:hypothetical protein